MGNPSQFLSGCFEVFTKAAGNRKSEKSKGKHDWIQYPVAIPEEICRQFSLPKIRAATNNFHPNLLLSESEFGSVYKGIVDDGTLVAVKRLRSDAVFTIKLFRTEVQLLCQLCHQHLVSLIGYCNDKDEKIVVYELKKNGSLRDHLYGCGYDPLPWKQRLEICIGAARGLHYLHTGAKRVVIHHDVKSSSILLDDKWVSKFSALGLSKIRSQSSYNKAKALEKSEPGLKGTLGYMDPEYFRDSEISEKSDVYSFGVVLFEVLCARPPAFNLIHNRCLVCLIDWVHHYIGEGTIHNIIDPYLKGKIAPECFKLFVDIALCCISEKRDKRPEIGEVELMLELALEMQEKADSEMKDLDPHGECMYGEISFPISVSDHIGVDDGNSSEFTWRDEKHPRIHHLTAFSQEIHRQLSLTQIKVATNNFHPNMLIGRGSSGNVYKGFIDDGNLVAVKRLNPDAAQAFNKFQTELQLLCQLRHPHLVSLFGICNDKDKDEMILVSELVKNGTLSDHLYGSEYDPLPWKQRLKICIDAARGLHYLHTSVKPAIIHGDVKSSNILLDYKWAGKLSDFGLSKMCSQLSYSSTSKALEKVNSVVKGSNGCLDPEYLKDSGLSKECDVHSFGLVLFEVLCARKVFDPTLDEDERHLADWVRRCIDRGTIYNIIDPYLKGKIAPTCFKIFMDLAHCCTSLEGNTWPEMDEVTLMLKLALEMQEKADSQMKNLDPHGDCMYGEISFSYPRS
ncbi:probable serine/threonine-protein kinase At1g01540 [Herrania umbratica]|uniref:Probable serine/threonine-protein kinase At1g01540 n=1 Tax=Herrania umbratica TaxID=108875 RepID=A0A6J1B843_9ROSI|nr:probable serine/threonine-protein kinase At1g01540 [Herrania umbratica]